MNSERVKDVVEHMEAALMRAHYYTRKHGTNCDRQVMEAAAMGTRLLAELAKQDRCVGTLHIKVDASEFHEAVRDMRAKLGPHTFTHKVGGNMHERHAAVPVRRMGDCQVVDHGRPPEVNPLDSILERVNTRARRISEADARELLRRCRKRDLHRMVAALMAACPGVFDEAEEGVYPKDSAFPSPILEAYYAAEKELERMGLE